MTGAVLALVAAYGMFLLYTALALGWTGLGVGPRLTSRPQALRALLAEAGLDETRLAELFVMMVVLFAVGSGAGFLVFGGVAPPLLAGGATATVPIAAARSRCERRRDLAREAWPRLIEEIRLQTSTLGRSVPQALLSVGLRGPEELRPAFFAAQREWLLSTDMARTVAVLKEELADPTADAVCETLLVAHEVGGSDLDRRLAALVEDRVQDLQGRKDARAKQAGARFARWFVLVAPLGMALAGLSIGSGRQAYATPAGQAGVMVGLVVMMLCWLWAGRIMRLPSEERVFGE